MRPRGFVSLVFGMLLTTATAHAEAPAKKPAAKRGVALLGGEQRVGDPVIVENLNVFPIYGEPHPEYDGMLSLEAALESGQAKVRELGAKGNRRSSAIRQGRANNSWDQVQSQQASFDSGAQVGKLVIENSGKQPILVLAGTVVKGGKQDRQVGQDFVIAPNSVAEVDAFCVEQGRWSAVREGRGTQGAFSSTGLIAPQKVRAAAQYEADQGKVWAQVAEVNAKAKKQSASGTLMATYDDGKVAKQSAAMAKQVEAFFTTLPAKQEVVGLAYAVDGKVRGARWFIGHGLFLQHRKKLVQSAALEAVVAQAVGGVRHTAVVTAEQVRAFVDELRKAKVERTRETEAMNKNNYRRSKSGSASEALIEMEGQAVPLTSDYLAH